jgi:hypothetical protein
MNIGPMAAVAWRAALLRAVRGAVLLGAVLLGAVVGVASPARGQGATASYPNMAPVDQYLIADRRAEIALARSAAPASISDEATVMVMGRTGYETAASGTNGFVCVVQRSWTAGASDPGFWNPKLRAPICFNPAAARSYLPLIIKKTALILAGRSKAEMVDSVRVALDRKELPTAPPGAMCYMMSRQQYLGDGAKQWYPHVMFFSPPARTLAWGANLPGSPVLADSAPEDRVTIFMIPVARWSDGTVAPEYKP